MQGAVEAGSEPFASALELNERLFSVQKIPLGIEHSLSTGAMPCGFWVDMERARFARRGVVEILNSRGIWETRAPAPVTSRWDEAFIWEPARKPENQAAPETGEVEAMPVEGRWRPLLSLARMLDGVGAGSLIRLEEKNGVRQFGRELVLGTRRPNGTLSLSPWMKRKLALPRLNLAALETQVLARMPELTDGGRLVNLFPRGEQLVAHLSYGSRPVQAWIDSHGRALIAPPERRELPEPCRGCEVRDPHALEHATPGRKCPQLSWCLGVEIQSSPSYSWRQLGLSGKLLL
ncbi:MAG: hypothetical protein EOP87_26870, partial [Verrucomicrobiaceae bacterium]